MAKNQKTMKDVEETNVAFQENRLFDSLLNGMLSDEELHNYKKAYSYILNIVRADRSNSTLLSALKDFFPEIYKDFESALMIQQNKLFNLHFLNETCFSVKDYRYLDVLCFCGIATLAGVKLTCNDFFRDEFFGFFFHIFTGDCDIDKEFSRFFSLKNSVVHRKYLIKSLSVDEKVFNETTKRQPFLKFDTICMLEEIFIDAMMKFGINPHGFRKEKNDEQWYQIEQKSRYYSIRDKLCPTDAEMKVISKTESYLHCLLNGLQKNKPIAKDETTNVVMEQINSEENLKNSKKEQDQSVPVSVLKQRIETLKDKINGQEKEISTLKQVLDEGNREKEKLTNEKQALEDILYNYVFQGSDNSENYSNLDEKAKNILYDSKGVIIGGHHNSMNKLLHFLPHWTVIDTNNPSKSNWAAIKDAQVIVMQIGYISHNVYYQAMSIIPSKTRIIFIQNNNSEMILSKIYNKLKQLNSF